MQVPLSHEGLGAVHYLIPRVVVSPDIPAESREPTAVSRFQFSIA